MQPARRYPRVRAEVKAQLTTVDEPDLPVYVEIHQISLGGCLISGAYPMGAGRVFFLTARFPTGKAVFVVTSRYEYSYNGKYYTGFAFDEDGPHPQPLLDYIEGSIGDNPVWLGYEGQACA